MGTEARAEGMLAEVAAGLSKITHVDMDAFYASVVSSSPAPPGSGHKPPDRDKHRINNERPQDGGEGWRNHAATDTRGQPPANEPGRERKCGMTR